VDLARDLLTRFGSLNGIFAASRESLTEVKGIDTSKYTQLQTIFEMSCCALSEEMQARDVLGSSGQVRDYLYLKLGSLSREVFMVLFLDAQNRVLAQEEMFSGTLTQTSAYPREVVKRALHYNAASVIITHLAWRSKAAPMSCLPRH